MMKKIRKFLYKFYALGLDEDSKYDILEFMFEWGIPGIVVLLVIGFFVGLIAFLLNIA